MPRRVLPYPRLIICEGASDEAFFRKLIKNRGLLPFCVRHTGDSDPANKGGKSKFGKFLQGLPAWHGFYSLQSIIVVGDNDTVPADDLKEIKQQIVASATPVAVPAVKYGVPNQTMQFEPGSPAKLAIMMLPDASNPGDLGKV